MRAATCRSLALAFIAVVQACAPAPPPPGPPSHNLLLIVSDTLRADAIQCYGGRARTPGICSLAERGVLFENAYSNAPWTLPSSVAMFTGDYPAAYARAGFGRGARTDRDSFFHVFDQEILLAEALRARGYEAVHYVETGVAPMSNAFQGFASREVDSGEAVRAIESELPGILQQLGEIRHQTVVETLKLLLDIEEGQRFFLLLWINDPHAVYAPANGFRQELHDPDLPHPLSYYMGLGYRDQPDSGKRKLRAVQSTLGAVEVDLLNALYHREVETVDIRVGLVLEALDRLGLSDETIVAFTSDHGEAFGEHGTFLHGEHFYDELVHVPLILSGPGIEKGRRIKSNVSHVDLMPTLRNLMGVDCLDDIPGQSLVPLLSGSGSPDDERFHYIGSPFRLQDSDAVIYREYKLIANGSELLLFDRSTDPGEQVDVSDQRVEIRNKMHRALKRIRSETEARRQANLHHRDLEMLRRIDQSTKEKLRALGYAD